MMEHLHLGKADVSVFHTAKGGNWCSGDDYFATAENGSITCAMADGLGSGEEAMEAASIAMTLVKEEASLPLEQLFHRINDAMSGTRGAVVSILRIYPEEEQCEYMNVGNITLHLHYPDGNVVRPVPKRGYLSGRPQRPVRQNWEFPKNTYFSMYSDGFAKNPLHRQLFSIHESPEEIMLRISREINHIDDDATFMVGRLVLSSKEKEEQDQEQQ
ncbi:SpoIIE family protein phosphatase [Alkalicoccus urumqiensis]|uniref:PPM-type phosphatase domain-containing protein n=1 Tax=Alkalicoccus urumqiensis TaxID=1548213 RepID=A0A2P6MHY0_ALKUR|nr:SpoIIE family protein phosphatase [Alkalicoccus urumqiensis]PRO65891.1 hypothetical protein C6I21_06180 [Alkalicoccus urumqiensis]